jgi:hypothetical protein
MIRQKRKNPRRLLLNMRQRAVFTELERLFIEFKNPKSNNGHGAERRETETTLL